MPEGDTIHTIARYLGPRLVGITLDGGRLRHQPDARLRGRRVTAVTARGKHLLLTLEDGTVIRSHLGMHGSWHRYERGESWRLPGRQAAIVLEASGDVFVCFNAREVEVLRAGGVRARQMDGRLGPDLVAVEGSLDDVVRRARAFRDPEVSLAEVMLDQRIASGVGNVYKSEVLFLEKLRPHRALGSVGDAELLAAMERARSLLRRNLEGGPRVTRFEGDGRGRLWVYGRRERPCLRCGTPIEYERTGNPPRATYWCATCQL